MARHRQLVALFLEVTHSSDEAQGAQVRIGLVDLFVYSSTLLCSSFLGEEPAVEVNACLFRAPGLDTRHTAAIDAVIQRAHRDKCLSRETCVGNRAPLYACENVKTRQAAAQDAYLDM